MSVANTAAVVDPYPDIIARSFLNNSIRSALLIDDQFPMFNTPEADLASYTQADRARRLYRMFVERNIICDIESRPELLNEFTKIERLVRSDLVVLDYHLNKGDDTDPSKSIAILRNLATTPNFNVVALYTASKDLRKVWLQIAAALKGGWTEPEKMLDESILPQWEKLEDDGTMPLPEEDLLIEYLASGEKSALRSASGSRLRQNFEDAGVEKSYCSGLITALISSHFRKRLVNVSFDESVALQIKGACNDPYWIQCGNLFVAILSKEDPKAGDEASTDPERIWERLTAAIQNWRPNLLQIVLSEIQNILELGAVTIDVSFAGSQERQAGILYSLFNNLPEDSAFASDEFLFPAIEDFTWKLVESIRRHISTNDELLKIAGSIIKYELSKDDWKKLPSGRKEKIRKLLGFVKKHLMKDSDIKDEDAFLELNAFHSADMFRGSHLTTGTLFKSADEESWWMCCSPACDMVPRPPSGSEWKRKPWPVENHPLKKMVALRLEPVDPPTKDLNAAEQGRSIFIRLSDGRCQQFKVMDQHNHLYWEVMLLDDAGRIELGNSGAGKGTFKAELIQAVTYSPDGTLQDVVACRLEKKTFSIIAQIRPEYASRILQYTGHHLSRIGVDFYNLQ